MKYIFTPLFVLLSLMSLQAQKGYDIQAKVDGFQAEEAYLAYYFGEKQYIKDTVQVENGIIRFTGEEPLDGGIYLVVLPPENQYFELIVDKDQHFAIETKQEDFVMSMKVNGSKDNELFYKDMRFLGSNRIRANEINEQIKELGEGDPKVAGLKDELTEIDQKVKDGRKDLMEKNPNMLYTKVLKAMIDPVVPDEIKDDRNAAFYYYRNNYFNNLDFSDDRLLRTPVMYNRVNTFLENLTVKHPDSINKSVDIVLNKSAANDDVFQFFTVNTLNKFAKSKVMGMDAVYVHIVESVYMQGRAWWADEEQVAQLTERALAISPTILGRKAPNFRLKDAQDNWTDLHATPGKYTILYFWSYDCGHCQKETPKLAKIWADYKDKDVSLFTVSINGDVEIWKEKIKEYKLEGAINTQDHVRRSGFDSMYDIRSTPRVFVLDTEKNIIAKQISVEQISEVLNHELGIEEVK